MPRHRARHPVPHPPAEEEAPWIPALGNDGSPTSCTPTVRRNARERHCHCHCRTWLRVRTMAIAARQGTPVRMNPLAFFVAEGRAAPAQGVATTTRP